jgi:coenzyme F420-reducing hydrogenase alpha subunit
VNIAAELDRCLEERICPTTSAARELLSQSHHFHRRADRFFFKRQDDVLVVEGDVPTFYLKQMLQCLLRNLDEIRRVDNRVRVICSGGLSSTAD